MFEIIKLIACAGKNKIILSICDGRFGIENNAITIFPEVVAFFSQYDYMVERHITDICIRELDKLGFKVVPSYRQTQNFIGDIVEKCEVLRELTVSW